MNCELCGKPIVSKYAKRFCSVACRNTNNSRQNTKRIDIPSEGIRFHRRECPTCGNVGDRLYNQCSICANRHVWTSEETQFLIDHYATNGAAKCAESLGITHQSVLDKVSVLGLTLCDDTYRIIVHGAASDHLTRHNPSHSPESKAKMRRHYEQHPEKHERVMQLLFEGHARIQRSKPTKLELKLFAILDELSIEYEPFCMIKPKFIVDCKIGSLIIQADGDYWHGHPRFTTLTDRQQQQQKRDKAQDKYLQSCGYTIYRIWESDMSKDTVIEILIKHDLINRT